MSAGLYTKVGGGAATPVANLRLWNGASAYTAPISALAWNGTKYVQEWPPTVTYGATGAGSKGNSGIQSWQHPLQATDSYVVVGFFYNGVAAVNNVSFGGVYMRQLNSLELNGGYYLELYGLQLTAGAQPPNNYTVQVSLTSSAYMCGNSVSYANVTGTYGGIDNSGYSTSAVGGYSVSRPGDMIVVLNGTSGSGNWQTNYGTARWNYNYGFVVNYPALFADYSFPPPTPGNTTMGATNSQTGYAGAISINLTGAS